MDVEEMLRDIVEDKRSGSSRIMMKTIDLLEVIDPERQNEIMSRIVEAHPSMAGLSNLMRTTGARNLAEIKQEIENSNRRTIENLREPVRDRSVVVISRSHISEQGLVTASEVTVLLSEPGAEGRDTAQYLEGRSIAVKTVFDAEMGYAVRECDAVVVGADTILPEGFINKVGTLPLALTARHFGKPFYVASPSYKTARESEVNEPFEFTPSDLITGLITERGMIGLQKLFE
ncbi:MAG: hypothetical protein R6U44_02980 [Archaeoglobaceae archaeon]